MVAARNLQPVDFGSMCREDDEIREDPWFRYKMTTPEVEVDGPKWWLEGLDAEGRFGEIGDVEVASGAETGMAVLGEKESEKVKGKQKVTGMVEKVTAVKGEEVSKKAKRKRKEVAVVNGEDMSEKAKGKRKEVATPEERRPKREVEEIQAEEPVSKRRRGDAAEAIRVSEVPGLPCPRCLRIGEVCKQNAPGEPCLRCRRSGVKCSLCTTGRGYATRRTVSPRAVSQTPARSKTTDYQTTNPAPARHPPPTTSSSTPSVVRSRSTHSQTATPGPSSLPLGISSVAEEFQFGPPPSTENRMHDRKPAARPDGITPAHSEVGEGARGIIERNMSVLQD
jgi:hypothetical protein